MVDNGRPLGASSVSAVLEVLAAPAPAAAGGSAAALAAAMGAGLVRLVADVSRRWEAAPDTSAAAKELCDRLVALADDDAAAFAAALDAMRASREGGDTTARDAALSRATDVPLEIALAAAEVARLGASAATHGVAHVRPDAVTAVALAEAAAAAAAALVRANLRSHPEDERIGAADAAAGRAAAARAAAAG